MDTKQWTNGEFNPAFGAATATIEVKPAWPSDHQQQQEWNWTARVTRPVAGDCPDYLLSDRQQTWDAAETKRKEAEAHFAKRQAELDAVAQSQRDASAKAFADQQAAAAKRREDELHAIHLSQGGTESTWQAERDETLKADRQRRTLGTETPVRSLIDVRQFI
jgi:hypothetical protein